MHRRAVNKRASARKFRKDVAHTARANIMISRGGYRL